MSFDLFIYRIPDRIHLKFDIMATPFRFLLTGFVVFAIVFFFNILFFFSKDLNFTRTFP